MGRPVDVLLGIQAYVCHHTGEEDMVGGAQVGDGHGLPLQVADGANLFGPEQLEAANMDTPQQDYRVPRVHVYDEWRNKRHADLRLARGEDSVLIAPFCLNVSHISEPLPLQELFGHVLGSY